MNLSSLKKITHTPKRRKGLGHGTGRSKTAGRGTKGQKARGKVAFTKYSGGSLAFVKRLPVRRGKLRNYSLQAQTLPVNLSALNTLPKGTVVDVKALVSHKILTAKNAKYKTVKILGGGELTVALTIKLPTSNIAREKIEKAGGTVSA